MTMNVNNLTAAGNSSKFKKHACFKLFLPRYSPKTAQAQFFTLKPFLRVVRSQFFFLHILWNLCNVFKSYIVVIGDVENL